MAAPIGNKNSEKWTIEIATELFESCLITSKDTTLDCNDFIGEVAQKNDTSLGVLEYLKSKFPELESVYIEIKQNCESNCFRNGKKGTIVPSLAIMNLKSNHGWKDRTDITTNDKDLTTPPIKWTDESD